MKRIIKNSALFIAFASLVSCGGSGKTTSEAPADSTVVKVNTDSVKKDIVLYNIPSPLETFTILKMSGSGFDKALLNPTDKISKYTTSFQKSVNLGVYSTDLSCCFLYKQNQEFNNCLKNINELTTALGIDGSYGQSITKRLQANGNNMDSLMQIVTEATINADMYLKENQRNNTTAMIATGAWTEAMHIIVNIADKKDNKDVMGLVADQRNGVKNLVKMLEQFGSDADITDVLKDVKDIAAIYDTLKPVQGAATASKDKAIASVGNNTSYEVSKEQLKSILDKVESLRNKLTL